MSSKGPRAILGSQLLPVEDLLAPDFEDNHYEHEYNVLMDSKYDTKLRILRTTSVHDKENQRVLFFVPAEASYSVFILPEWYVKNEYQRVYVFNYRSGIWSEFSFISENGAGGAEYHDGLTYFLSRSFLSGGNRGVLYRENNWGPKYDYADNVSSIPTTWKMGHEMLDEPSVDKHFSGIKLWSVGRSEPYPFSVRVRVYRNFKATASTDVTKTFATSDDVDVVIDPTYERSKIIQVMLTSTALYQCPHITGIEIEVSPSYAQDELEELND